MQHEMDDGIQREQRVKETAEIFTPTIRVKELLNRLNLTENDYQNKNFLDPTCGNGQFLVELAKRGVPAKNLYAVDIMSDNIEKVKERLSEFYTPNEMTQLNIVQADALKYDFRFGSVSPWGVTFHYIVGNPPYQNKRTVLYHNMINKFLSLDFDYMVMIIPNRWMVGGKGLSSFRKQMQNNKHIQQIVEYPDDFEVFNTVWIRGGIQFITFTGTNNKLIDYIRVLNNKVIQQTNRVINLYDIVIRNQLDINLLNKLENTKKIEIPNISFGIPAGFSDYEEHFFEGSIKLYGMRQRMIPKNGGEKGIGYIKYDLKTHMNKYKVITRGATSNNSKRVVNPVFIIEPDAVASDTYLVLGLFDDLKEAEDFCLFVSTKFVRYLVGIRKISVALNSKTFKFVPEMPKLSEYTDSSLLKYYDLEEYKTQIETTVIDRAVNHINKEQYPREINTWVNDVKWD